MNTANKLTISRICLIPVFIAAALFECAAAGWAAFAVFVIASLTDYVDGRIARKYNMISAFGKFLDPLADKATQFTLIICLSTKHTSLWYVLALFIIKEVFQLIAASIKFKQGIILKEALLSGKICTTVLFCSLIILVMIPNLPNKIVNILATVNFIFLLISFVHYLYVYIKADHKFQKIDLT